MEAQRPGACYAVLALHKAIDVKQGCKIVFLYQSLFVCLFVCFCRYYGRKILHIMYDHPEFDKNVTKHVPSNLQKSVRDTVEHLKTKVRFVTQYRVLPRLYCVTKSYRL